MNTTTSLTLKDTKTGTSARGAWKLSIFSGADGREYTTLKGDVASAAQALTGQIVSVEYEERPGKEGYGPNYSLLGVSAIEPEHQARALAEAQAAQAAAPATGGKKGEFRSPEQIIRSSAAEIAAGSFAALGLNPVEDVVGFLEFAVVIETYITEGIDEEPEA